jgi:hypothetical protein
VFEKVFQLIIKGLDSVWHDGSPSRLAVPVHGRNFRNRDTQILAQVFHGAMPEQFLDLDGVRPVAEHVRGTGSP